MGRTKTTTAYELHGCKTHFEETSTTFSNGLDWKQDFSVENLRCTRCGWNAPRGFTTHMIEYHEDHCPKGNPMQAYMEEDRGEWMDVTSQCMGYGRGLGDDENVYP